MYIAYVSLYVCAACPDNCQQCSQSNGVVTCNPGMCVTGYARAVDGSCQSGFSTLILFMLCICCWLYSKQNDKNYEKRTKTIQVTSPSYETLLTAFTLLTLVEGHSVTDFRHVDVLLLSKPILRVLTLCNTRNGINAKWLLQRVICTLQAQAAWLTTLSSNFFA